LRVYDLRFKVYPSKGGEKGAAGSRILPGRRMPLGGDMGV
jgi:hypothetical protein